MENERKFLYEQFDDAKKDLFKAITDFDMTYNTVLGMIKGIISSVNVLMLIGFVAVVLMSVPFWRIIPWYSFLIYAAVWFCVAVGVGSIESSYNSHLYEARCALCSRYLENCRAYVNMEEWQKKQIFNAEISNITGIKYE